MENKDDNDKNKSVPETEKNIKENYSESFLEKKIYYPFVPSCWAGPLFFK
jgi:hypothetical protein